MTSTTKQMRPNGKEENAGTGQIKMAPVKMKTCHHWQNTTAAAAALSDS